MFLEQWDTEENLQAVSSECLVFKIEWSKSSFEVLQKHWDLKLISSGRKKSFLLIIRNLSTLLTRNYVRTLFGSNKRKWSETLSTSVLLSAWEFWCNFNWLRNKLCYKYWYTLGLLLRGHSLNLDINFVFFVVLVMIFSYCLFSS